METENTTKPTPFVYHLEWFDNGISCTQPEAEIYELEKFSNNGKPNDLAIHQFLGKTLWEDICYINDELLSNKLKITITIESDE